MEEALKDIVDGVGVLETVQLDDDLWHGFPTAQDLFDDISKEKNPDQHVLAHLLDKIKEAKKELKFFCNIDTRKYYKHASPTFYSNTGLFLSRKVYEGLLNVCGFTLFLICENGIMGNTSTTKCDLNYQKYQRQCIDKHDKLLCHTITWNNPRPVSFVKD